MVINVLFVIQSMLLTYVSIQLIKERKKLAMVEALVDEIIGKIIEGIKEEEERNGEMDQDCN